MSDLSDLEADGMPAAPTDELDDTASLRAGAPAADQPEPLDEQPAPVEADDEAEPAGAGDELDDTDDPMPDAVPAADDDPWEEPEPLGTHAPSPEDTGSFAQIGRIARVEDLNADPVVYGLEDNLADDEARRARNTTLRLILGGIAAAAAIIGVLLIAKPFGIGKAPDGPRTEPVVSRKQAEEEEADDQADASQDADEQGAAQAEPEPEPTPEPEPAPEPEPEPAFTLPDQPTVEDITRQARLLTFDGQDLTLPKADLSVEVLGGRVQVTHVIASTTGIDPAKIAGKAAQRCAALASTLNSRPVKGANEQEAIACSSVLWIVRNPDGDSYLAVVFPSDAAPTTGDGLTVLAQCPRYRLSDSLYEALGRTIQQENGETPATLDGIYIWSTAVL